MGFRAALLLPLLLTALVLPASGQGTEPAPLMEDAAGDVMAQTAGGDQAWPAGTHSELDLRSFWVVEDQASFTFNVAVEDLRPNSESTMPDGAVIETRFQHNGREFRLGIIHNLPAIDGFIGTYLEFRDNAESEWQEVWWRPGGVSLDVAKELYSVAVPRDDLADAMGAAPYPDRRLEGFVVEARNLASHFNFNAMDNTVPAPVTLLDVMPDGGASTAFHAVQHGLRQDGTARLTSEEPFRASNGEGTTFLYTAVGHNLAQQADTFTMRAASVPAGWTVVLPVPEVHLEAGSAQEVPVLVTLPFTHLHGSSESFVLEMASRTDTSVGRIAMGVRFLTIPQPAGHHNTVYFHSRPFNDLSTAIGTVFTGNDGYGYMNTLEATEAGPAITPQSSYLQDGTTGVYQWCLALDPGLQMGLDFDTRGLGQISVPLQVVTPMNQAVLRAELLLVPSNSNRWACYNRENVLLGQLEGSPPTDIAANSQAVLAGEIAILPDADRIPYTKGQNIQLLVTVEATTAPTFFFAQGAPRLLPGGQMTLPLLEYHDDVQAALSTLRGTALVPLGPQERRANPGGLVVFPVSIANDGDVDRTYHFNLTGANMEWAIPPSPVVVPPHATARVHLTVRVPQNAANGQTADLVLQARDEADVLGRGLLRLVVVVVTGETIPDDAPPATAATEETPGLAPVVAVVAFGAAAWSRRGIRRPRA